MGQAPRTETELTKNQILRRIRYVFDFNDSMMITLFRQGGAEVTRDQISAWLKREEQDGFRECSDTELATFLNGLIVHRRGKRDGPRPQPERVLTNNMILVKLRIALNLRAEGMLEILQLADRTLSKHELSALFRKPGHKHFRVCQDQILRNFLRGMTLKFRPGSSDEASEA